MRGRLYLDTSVIGVYFDPRRPERQAETRAFWRQLAQLDVSISDLTEAELRETAGEILRQEMQALVRPFTIIPLDADMRELARYYLDRGIFPRTVVHDALHMACAVVSSQDLFVSWNFRHVVNWRRRALMNEANIARGYPTIEIVAPPEV